MMSGFVTVCFLKKIICPLLKLCYSYIEKKKKNRMCFPDSIVDLHSVQYIVLVRVSNHSYTVTLFFFFSPLGSLILDIQKDPMTYMVNIENYKKL